MDFVRSCFNKNEPLTSWTLLSSLFFQISTPFEHFCLHFLSRSVLIWKKVRTKVFNWSEVHLYRSNFFQNPYFNLPIYFVTYSHRSIWSNLDPVEHSFSLISQRQSQVSSAQCLDSPFSALWHWFLISSVTGHSHSHVSGLKPYYEKKQERLCVSKYWGNPIW